MTLVIYRWFFTFCLLQAEEKAHSEVKFVACLYLTFVYICDEMNVSTTGGLYDTVA